jgi:hypothetical protein
VTGSSLDDEGTARAWAFWPGLASTCKRLRKQDNVRLTRETRSTPGPGIAHPCRVAPATLSIRLRCLDIAAARGGLSVLILVGGLRIMLRG